MGGGNDKVEQNQAAQTQIHTNTQEAQNNLLQWLSSHPSVLAQMPGSVAPPQQFSGSVGGGNVGQPPQQQPHPMLQRALQQRMPMGTPGMAPGQTPPGAPPAAYQGGTPPGLLGLLSPTQRGQ